MPTKILIVDDQQDLCESLAMLFRMEDMEVAATTHPQQAIAAASAKPDVVLTDLRMEGMDGITLLRKIKDASPETEVIIMTAFATIDTAIQAIKMGAFDYITKPFRNEAILAKVRHAAGQSAQRMARSAERPSSIVSGSPAMTHVMDLVHKLAPTALPLLLTGETGTGKSVLARAIHDLSARRNGPFVQVNCSALPESLVESELFGHQKGAFTGAVTSHRGLFRDANGGTLFLDEIALLPLVQQPKLLLALEERIIRPVGATQGEPIDVRIIAATNSSLPERVASGQFREDLFYRLNAATIHVPPLRGRREDIKALAEMSLRRYAGPNSPAKQIDMRALAVLEAYDFPGNVRELDNAIHWAQIVATGATVTAADLPDIIRHQAGLPGATAAQSASPEPSKTLSDVTRATILDCINRNQGNLNQTAKELGISRTTLWRRLKDYEMG